MSSKNNAAVALGSFDGLHKGHKAVIACALSKKERGLVPTVLLFDTHPLLTLTGTAPDEILQNDLRDEKLIALGVKIEHISFSEIRDYTPTEFFEKVILDKLNAGAVCCGENYQFGKGGVGGVAELKELCKFNSVDFTSVPLVSFEGSPISSTRIRTALVCGDIIKANEMLGYEFSYKRIVKSGFQRGRLLGAPTINQYFGTGAVVPKYGVYASVTVVDGCEYPSVTNIGLRPTFENDDPRSETCIIGFDGNLYGCYIEVKLIDYMRGEIRFNSMEALSNQISADAEKSKQLFIKRGDRHV